jgi:hypothetical protein
MKLKLKHSLLCVDYGNLMKSNGPHSVVEEPSTLEANDDMENEKAEMAITDISAALGRLSM